MEKLEKLIKSQLIEIFGSPILNENNGLNLYWKKNVISLQEIHLLVIKTILWKFYWMDKIWNISATNSYITQAKEGDAVGRTIDETSILMTCMLGV